MKQHRISVSARSERPSPPILRTCISWSTADFPGRTARLEVLCPTTRTLRTNGLPYPKDDAVEPVSTLHADWIPLPRLTKFRKSLSMAMRSPREWLGLGPHCRSVKVPILCSSRQPTCYFYALDSERCCGPQEQPTRHLHLVVSMPRQRASIATRKPLY